MRYTNPRLLYFTLLRNNRGPMLRTTCLAATSWSYGKDKGTKLRQRFTMGELTTVQTEWYQIRGQTPISQWGWYVRWQDRRRASQPFLRIWIWFSRLKMVLNFIFRSVVDYWCQIFPLWPIFSCWPPHYWPKSLVWGRLYVFCEQ